MRYRVAVLAHGVVIAAVLLFAQLHAQYVGHYDLWIVARLRWTFAFAVFLIIAAYAAGLPDEVRSSAKSRFLSSISAAFGAAVGISLVQLVVGSPLLPRFVVFWATAFAIPWYALCARVVDDRRSWQSRQATVIAVVSNEEAKLLLAELGRHPEREASLVAHVDLEDVHGEQSLVELANAAHASLVVLNRSALADDFVVGQAALLHEHGVRVRTLSLFYEEWLGKLPVWELERTSLMFDIGEVHRSHYARQKRLLDVVAALVGLPFLALALLFIAVGDLIANRGPLLFRQVRVGRGGKLFVLTKFRTMRPGGDESTWTTVDDQRITPFGKLLRRTHLDELPQLWNVLLGDLSVVGPRPEQPAYVEQLKEALPFYNLRHLVRPGLTGWAQVKHAYGASVDDSMEKLQYEFFYLRRQGWSLDVRIIARTVRRIVRLRGH